MPNQKYRLHSRNNPSNPYNPTATPDLESGDYIPSYTHPDQAEDDREAAEIRAATELLGY